MIRQPTHAQLIGLDFLQDRTRGQFPAYLFEGQAFSLETLDLTKEKHMLAGVPALPAIGPQRDDDRIQGFLPVSQRVRGYIGLAARFLNGVGSLVHKL